MREAVLVSGAEWRGQPTTTYHDTLKQPPTAPPDYHGGPDAPCSFVVRAVQRPIPPGKVLAPSFPCHQWDDEPHHDEAPAHSDYE